MDRKHLYQIYTKHERSAYFVPHVEPRLKVYIQRQIPDGSSPSQVIEQARILVEAVRELPVQGQDCTAEQKNQKEFIIQLRKQKNQSESITALLGYTLFVKKKVRLDKSLEILQRYFQGTDLDDVCQFSSIVISQPNKFLQNFRAESDWYESLCRYAHNKFPKSLTVELRRVAGDKFKRTNLGVLALTSPRKVATIIAEQFKRDGDYFNRLVLLHQCFQELVKTEKIAPSKPKSARKDKEFVTNEPKPEHYDALLDRYRERKTQQQLDIADRAEVTELLEDLSNSVRNYYQPTGGAESLDKVLYPGGDSTSDITLGAMQEAPMTSLLPEDDDKQTLALDLLRQNSLSYTGVNLRLGIVAEPEPELEKVRLTDLKLFWLNGLDLSQTEVGEEVDRPQYKICREVKKEIARLAKELYFRYEKVPPVKKIPAETLDGYMSYVEPLCEDYYAELAIDLLERTIASTTGGSIVDEFIHRIETRWQFRFKPEGGGLAKVYAFVQQQQHHQNWDDESKIHKDLRLKKKD